MDFFIFAPKARDNTSKILGDCSEPITTLRFRFFWIARCIFFLVKGLNFDKKKFTNLLNYFKSPLGSDIIMTTNTFTTDETWIIIVTKLCKVVRKISIVCNCPCLWEHFYLEGCDSHANAINDLTFFWVQDSYCEGRRRQLPCQSGTLLVYYKIW